MAKTQAIPLPRPVVYVNMSHTQLMKSLSPPFCYCFIVVGGGEDRVRVIVVGIVVIFDVVIILDYIAITGYSYCYSFFMPS